MANLYRFISKPFWIFMGRHFRGHKSWHKYAPVCVYGANAMHFAINVKTQRWGWVCVQPTSYCFGEWWPWHAYCSPDATPSASTWAIGPGIDNQTKKKAKRREWLYGHNFKTESFPEYRNPPKVYGIDFFGPEVTNG